MRRSAAPSSRIGISNPLGVKQTITSVTTARTPPVNRVTVPVRGTPPAPDSIGIGTPVARSTASVLSLLTRASTSGESSAPPEGDSVLNGTSQPPVSLANKQPVQDATPESTTSAEKRIFNVVWGKQSTKKHKTWEGDGTLEVGEKTAILKDADGKILGRATQMKTAALDEGSRLKVGSKEVELIELLSGTAPKSTEATAASNKRPASDLAESSGKTSWKRPKKKINSNVKFTGFSADAADALVLPAPSHDHQWAFNSDRRQLTSVAVDSFLTRVLRPHQRDGVVFLYECVMGMRDTEFNGAILADEMGLGKTLQTITLIWTLLRQGPYGGIPVARRVLIVSPSSLVLNWQKEFDRWLGRHRLQTFAIDQKNKVSEFARLSHLPVMLISYEMFMRKFDEISAIHFDILVCDEGHRLKNTNIRTSVLLSQLDVKARVLLTGTPIQNDLQEFYALVNFVNPGILGSPSEFRKQYEDPIVASRQPDCPIEFCELGKERAAQLNARTSCFILRRTQAIINKYLPAKTESVIFVKPTPIQQTLCRSSLDWWENRDKTPGMNDGSTHLGVMTALKKICNHPALIRTNEASDFDGDEGSILQEGLLQELSALYNAYGGGAVAVHHSAKMNLVRKLLEWLAHARERVVLVSYFTQTLDVLAALCDELHMSYCRLDGSTPTAQRNQIVDQFNASHSKHVVFLLSARAGGVGLNLVGASRLVLFDSDWNPATDAQAMSRVWRDGQKRSVYIYRLLTCGSIEEKILQRQLSKTGLSGAVVEPNSRCGIRLSNAELKDIFTYHDGSESLTHKSLDCACDGRGNVPLPEDILNSSLSEEKENETDDGRDCQLHLGSAQNTTRNNESVDVRMNQLFRWQHHAPPYSGDVLEELGLSSVCEDIAFMFVTPSQGEAQLVNVKT